MADKPNRFREKEWETICQPFQMAPGVYYVGTSFVGSYLLDTGDGLILLDQAFAESVYIILENIRKLGYDPRDIEILLVSHGHLDHCGGTRLLQEYTGAKVYMSREDYEMMKEHPLWVHFGYENWIDFEPDEFYDDKTPVQLGKMSIQTILSPGHTPGTTSFFFEVCDHKGRKYRCGLHGGVGINTMVADFYKVWPGWPVKLRYQFISSLKQLLSERVDIALPSHPNQISIMENAGTYSEEHNPYLNQEVWKLLITERLKMVSELIRDEEENTDAVK